MKTFIRRFAFVVALVVVLLGLNFILIRKPLKKPGDTAIKVHGFVNEPADSMDIVAVGSSHMFCTLDPVYLYQETGLRAYDFCSQQQPPVASYYYIKEAIERQHPQLIILDVFAFRLFEMRTIASGVAHDAVDFFPKGVNRLKMIWRMNSEEKKFNLLFPLTKYHSRWSELTASDFDFGFYRETSAEHGFRVTATVNEENNSKQVSYDDVLPEPLIPEYEQTLLEIIQLTKEHEIPLLLINAPYDFTKSVYGKYKYISELAAENDVGYLDLNLVFDELGLVTETDFYDGGHLNVYGAEKVTAYIAAYIAENYHITESRYTGDEADWEKDIEAYQETLRQAEEEKETGKKD